jgi:outer membrane protein OmpA-like peptidoglycan-associated protein
MIKNFFTDKFRLILLASVAALFLNACVQPQQPENLNDQKLGLNEAVTALGKDLHIQLGEALRNTDGAMQSTQSIVIDPILSIESGRQFKANQQVVSILTRELGSGFKIDEISPETLAKAGYVLAGALSQRADLSTGTQSDCRLVITILELSTGMVKAKAQVNINGFPFEPLAFYEDSPIFLQDTSVRLAKLPFSWSIGQTVSPEYMQFLPVKADIQQGIISYELEQFTNAANWFSKAVAHPNGRTISSYAGLYLSLQKLHREDNANKAFTNLLKLAIEENHRLDLRLLFSADSPAFIPNPELAKRYAGWLKHIAVHMKKNNLCLDISGHSSRSGDKISSERLSLSRAKTIQGVMSVTYPGIIKKSHVDGKGFRENIVGNGANDASDEVDRRVELSVINCSELLKLNAK